MPRTKKHQPGSPTVPQTPPNSTNGLSGEVLTLAEAATYLRLPEAEVVRLVHAQGLPGRSVSSEWRFLKAAIQHWLATASPTWETRKAGILGLAGKYKEDTDLEQIVEEAYRQRGRSVTEGGSPIKSSAIERLEETRCLCSIPTSFLSCSARTLG